jgi:hypothetical protein
VIERTHASPPSCLPRPGIGGHEPLRLIGDNGPCSGRSRFGSRKGPDHSRLVERPGDLGRPGRGPVSTDRTISPRPSKKAAGTRSAVSVARLGYRAWITIDELAVPIEMPGRQSALAPVSAPSATRLSAIGQFSDSFLASEYLLPTLR